MMAIREFEVRSAPQGRREGTLEALSAHFRARRGDREPSLDGMRAVAVTSVVIFHVAVDNLLPGGWAGVDVFFVLSGYLITTLLKAELDQNGKIDFQSFYMRRVLRLGPAMVLLLFFYSSTIIFSRHRSDVLWSITMAATNLMNWSRAFGWHPPGVLDHTWSLSMEEQFYILWPLTLALVRNRRPLVWIAATLTLVITWRIYLVLSGAGYARTYNGFDTHADGLLIGCAVAFLPRVVLESRHLAQMVAIPIALLLFIVGFIHLNTIFAQTIGLTLAALCSGWLVVVCSVRSAPWVTKALSWPILVYTGRISYGWYLWHYLLLSLARQHLRNNVEVMGVVLVSYIVAMASFHFVEKPFLKLKKRFEPVAFACTARAAGQAA